MLLMPLRVGITLIGRVGRMGSPIFKALVDGMCIYHTLWPPLLRASSTSCHCCPKRTRCLLRPVPTLGRALSAAPTPRTATELARVRGEATCCRPLLATYAIKLAIKLGRRAGSLAKHCEVPADPKQARCSGHD